jgi:hypothetical protein
MSDRDSKGGSLIPLENRAYGIILTRANGIKFDELFSALEMPRQDRRRLDAALQRMRRDSVIRFAGPKTGWVLT